MPIKARPETLMALTEEDKAALRSIYFHRCLNESLLQRFFYAQLDDGQNDYTLERIRWFIKEELLAIDEYGDGQCTFYLTNRGLQTVRELLDYPTFIIDRKTGHRKYDVTSSSLRTAQKLLDHQMHLNALSLDIETRCGLPQEAYKDSKFAANFTYAQPDGVFELPDYDIFLEMDMAHERLLSIKDKWTHYRNYTSAREYYLRRDKKIIVLFATENITRGFAYRRGKVIRSIFGTIQDLLGDRFEIFIGPSSEMADVAERIIKQENGAFQETGAFLQSQMLFQFFYPAVVRDLTGERLLYMRQLDEKRETLVRDGRPQEFFLVDYLLRPMSGLKRALCHGHTQSLLAGKFPQVPLLLLVPDETSIYQDLRAAEAFGMENVFFTTSKRLRDRLLPEAIFQFDQTGNRYHFQDFALKEKIHEKRGD